MHVALINRSKYFAAHPDLIPKMVLLANAQQHTHFAAAWDQTPTRVTYYPDESKAPPADRQIRAYFFDEPDVADAGGYHDRDPHGNPYIKTFVTPYLDNGATVMDAPDSILGAFTHELCETDQDPDAGEWVQMPESHILVAKEMCDPVQDTGYRIRLTNGVAGYVTNFLTPKWFVPEARNVKFDYMGILTAPFTKTDGGYWILLNYRGDSYDAVSVDFGEKFPAWKKALKLGQHSRASRRLGGGVRIAGVDI